MTAAALARSAASPVPRVRGATGLALLALLCGLAGQVKLELVGEVYLAELLLLASLPFTLGGLSGLWSNPVFRRLLLAAALTFAGYMISDIARDSQPEQYLRGWARIAFVVLDFVAVAALCVRDPRNFWWFITGLGIGGVLYHRLALGLPLSSWKFGYAVPFSLVVLGLANFMRLRNAAFALGALGAYSVYADFRIHGAVCLGTAAVLLTAGSRRRNWFALAFFGALAYATLSLMLEAHGEYYEWRRASSEFGRLLGVKVGLAAIAESPLIGYGSWPQHPDLVRFSQAAFAELQAEGGAVGQAIPFFVGDPHSQILQGWMEGGLLGLAFFAVLGWCLLRAAWIAAFSRAADVLTPSILFFCLFQLWSLLQSPLGGTQRILIGVAAALAVLVEAERRRIRRA